MGFVNRHHALISAACFSAGLILAYHFLPQWPVMLTGLLFLIGLAGLLFTYVFQKALFYGIFVASTLLGGILIGIEHFTLYPKDHLLFKPIDQATALRGYITAATYRKDGRHRYVFECQALQIDSTWQKAEGKILLRQKRDGFRLKYGQRLILTSLPERPPLPRNPGEFNYRRYLNFQNIFFQSAIQADQIKLLPGRSGHFFQHRIIVPLQNAMRRIIRRNLPETSADLVQALILGERQNLERSVYQQFQKTGIVHVLAISGLHVGFVLLLFVTMLGFFPLTYRQKYLFSFLLLGLFVALVNFKAPVVRASLMAVLYFLLKEIGRRPSNLNILGLAALLILLFDPDQLFQPGFQFSFAAVAGILFGYPHLKQLLPWQANTKFLKRINRWLWQPTLVSLAAVLATLPLTWWYYGTIQLGAVFINLLIIPLMGCVVILSLLLILLGFLHLPVLKGLGLVIHLIVSAVKQLIALLAQIPFIQLQTAHPSLWLVLLAALLIFYGYQLQKRSARLKGGLLLILLLLFLNFKTEHGLRVTFIDVGQGDASLIQLPDGNHLLIDCGEHRPWLKAGEQFVKPLLRYLGVKTIKYAVATHPHTDHFGGFLTILKHVPTDTLIINSYPDQSKSYRQLLQLARQKNIAIRLVKRGDRLYLGEQVRAYVLHPFNGFTKVKQHNGHEINSSSLVIKLCYGKTSFLFSGDAEKDAELALARYQHFLRSSVLKVGHHGSITSSTDSFLNLVYPQFAVISAGKHNKFGHPSNLVLKRYRRLHIPVLRTDHLGAVMFESDGREIRLINWRKWLN